MAGTPCAWLSCSHGMPSLAERLGNHWLAFTLLTAARSWAAWKKGCLWGRPTSSSVLFGHEDVLVLQTHQ